MITPNLQVQVEEMLIFLHMVLLYTCIFDAPNFDCTSVKKK